RVIPADEPRLADARGRHAGEEAFRQSGVAVIEGEGQRHVSSLTMTRQGRPKVVSLGDPAERPQAHFGVPRCHRARRVRGWIAPMTRLSLSLFVCMGLLLAARPASAQNGPTDPYGG